MLVSRSVIGRLFEVRVLRMEGDGGSEYFRRIG